HPPHGVSGRRSPGDGRGGAREASHPGRLRGRRRHAPEEPARTEARHQAQGVRGTGAPAPGAEAAPALLTSLKDAMAEDTDKNWGTGKRKSSVARVRLFPGGGDIVVNRRTLEDYFPRETSRMIINQPFEVTSTIGQYRAEVNVYGGGVAAQAVAVRHGITR